MFETLPNMFQTCLYSKQSFITREPVSSLLLACGLSPSWMPIFTVLSGPSSEFVSQKQMFETLPKMFETCLYAKQCFNLILLTNVGNVDQNVSNIFELIWLFFGSVQTFFRLACIFWGCLDHIIWPLFYVTAAFYFMNFRNFWSLWWKNGAWLLAGGQLLTGWQLLHESHFIAVFLMVYFVIYCVVYLMVYFIVYFFVILWFLFMAQCMVYFMVYCDFLLYGFILLWILASRLVHQANQCLQYRFVLLSFEFFQWCCQLLAICV